MNEHTHYEDLLPPYAAGQLSEAERCVLETHLPECAACRADLALWSAVKTEVVAAEAALIPPPVLVDRVLARAAQPPPALFRRAWQLLRAQVPLVRGDIWPATLAATLVGYLAALLVGRAEFVRAFAPLMAAASLAVICGPEYDPAAELTGATPTSPRQILLARMTLVFGYNLLLALAASAGLLVIFPAEIVGQLILGWLGPMTFLSALALWLSVWLGAERAIVIAYTAWLAHFLAGTPFSDLAAPLNAGLQAYAQFWNSPFWMFSLAAGLVIWTMWLTGRREHQSLVPS